MLQALELELGQVAAIDPPESSAAAFIHESVDATNIVHVYGEVDLSNAHEFESAIGLPHSIDKMLVINLEPCVYMDSRGLGVLVRAKKQMRHNLKVQVAPGSNLERLLHVSSLHDYLT